MRHYLILCLVLTNLAHPTSVFPAEPEKYEADLSLSEGNKIKIVGHGKLSAMYAAQQTKFAVEDNSTMHGRRLAHEEVTQREANRHTEEMERVRGQNAVDLATVQAAGCQRHFCGEVDCHCGCGSNRTVPVYRYRYNYRWYYSYRSATYGTPAYWGHTAPSGLRWRY